MVASDVHELLVYVYDNCQKYADGRPVVDLYVQSGCTDDISVPPVEKGHPLPWLLKTPNGTFEGKLYKDHQSHWVYLSRSLTNAAGEKVRLIDLLDALEAGEPGAVFRVQCFRRECRNGWEIVPDWL